MNILIIGESGVGKSNLGDILKGLIFKHDKDCTITVDDPDRELKTLGHGPRLHTIHVSRDPNVKYREEMDMVIVLGTKSFKEWYDTVYSG